MCVLILVPLFSFVCLVDTSINPAERAKEERKRKGGFIFLLSFLLGVFLLFLSLSFAFSSENAVAKQVAEWNSAEQSDSYLHFTVSWTNWTRSEWEKKGERNDLETRESRIEARERERGFVFFLLSFATRLVLASRLRPPKVVCFFVRLQCTYSIWPLLSFSFFSVLEVTYYSMSTRIT